MNHERENANGEKLITCGKRRSVQYRAKNLVFSSIVSSLPFAGPVVVKHRRVIVEPVVLVVAKCHL